MGKNFTTRLGLWAATVALFLLPQCIDAQTWTPRNVSVGPIGGYYEYLPQGYNDPANSTKKYPLLYFNHGIGETGNGTTDLYKMLNTGLPQLINQGKFPSVFNVNGTNFSFIVICPQYPNWPASSDVATVLNYVVQNYRVDLDRVYMTGLSMGGGVTWDYAGDNTGNSNALAAILPISGAAYATTQKCQNMASTNLPVWATHNDNDGTVSVYNTLNFVNGINAFNPNPLAQKTIFSSYAHDAWTQTYDPGYKLDGTHNCYEWMLLYSRNGASPPPPPPPSPLTVWINSSTNVSCNSWNNGSATVGVAGGVTPYTYSWSTSPVQTGATATNLSPGTYTVTVKDAAGTTGTSTVTITQPAPLVLTVTPGTITTSGGTTNVTLSAAGGTAPYTYSGPTSNVAAGTYTYSVTDAKGCSDSKTVTITEPAPLPPPPPPPPSPLTVWINSSVNISCANLGNGSATVGVAGGVTPYTYSWSTSPVQTGATATNLSPGTYTVTVKDAAGTTGTSSVTITQPAPLVLTVTPGTITTSGGTTNVTLSAAGGTAPYTYSGPTSNLTAGTYTYSVTDAKGCSDSKTVTITEPVPPPPPPPPPAPTAALTATIGSSTNVSCSGLGNGSATVNVTGGVAPYTYSWSTSPVQTGATATSLAPGSYTVTVSDAAGTTASVSVTITQPSPLSLTVQAGTISNNGGTTNVNLVAAGGTAPYTYSGPTTNVGAGTYTYMVTDASGCTASNTVLIGQPAKLLLSAQSGSIRCHGSTTNVSLRAAGGQEPYTYEGDTMNVKAGTYTYWVTDANGSRASYSLTISEPSALELLLTPGTIKLMGGTTNVSVDARGGIGAYSFTGPTVNVSAGTYTYKVVDGNSCESSKNLDLKEPAVQLTGFAVNIMDTGVELQWSTGYEYAIDHYEVEKSRDDRLFGALSRVTSRGNSQGQVFYQSADAQIQSGENYYRLYVVTLYGERKLLDEKSLNYQDRGQVVIKNLTDRIEITLTSTKNERVDLILYDISGRPLKTLTEQKIGYSYHVSVPLTGLRAGAYVVRVITPTMNTSKQIIKP